MRQGMFTLSGAPSTTSHFGYHTSVQFYYYILSISHNLGSPLSYRMLIVDLMRILYISLIWIITSCPYFIIWEVLLAIARWLLTSWGTYIFIMHAYKFILSLLMRKFTTEVPSIILNILGLTRTRILYLTRPKRTMLSWRHTVRSQVES